LPSVHMNRQAVAVSPSFRRGQHGEDFRGGDPSDSAKQIRNLRGFCFKLHGVVHVLVGATAALPKNGALWNKATRRGLEDSDQISLCVVFL